MFSGRQRDSNTINITALLDLMVTLYLVLEESRGDGEKVWV